VLGVWVAGGVVTNDFKASMAITIAWGVFFGAACLWIAFRRPDLRISVIGSYLVTGALVAGVLGWMTLHDRVVDEQVVKGLPASQLQRNGLERGSRTPARAANLQLAAGQFRSVEHGSSGSAAVVELPDGSRRLTLTEFETAAGPDLRVRLVSGDATDGGADGAIDLGGLKGNKGNQQYELPVDVDLSRYTSVVVWCRAFSVAFAQARLTRS
jgi:hypothetical protein